ncbi:hypothetical protein AB0M54_24220 [Actinoplanes sp. NPDC051470]|uniref:hypothetical protein n=1 Tax=Actinoplanes sp. NPDC051470 TaxID=3157224 RepID=UPI00343D6341
MSALPKRGDRITIEWPGGPHNFVIKFEKQVTAEPPPSPGPNGDGWAGWVFLQGQQLEPDQPGQEYWRDLFGDDAGPTRVFFAEPAEDGTWRMLPMVSARPA